VVVLPLALWAMVVLFVLFFSSCFYFCIGRMTLLKKSMVE